MCPIYLCYFVFFKFFDKIFPLIILHNCPDLINRLWFFPKLFTKMHFFNFTFVFDVHEIQDSKIPKFGNPKNEKFPFSFFSIWVFFQNHLRITGLQGNERGHFFDSSQPLPPTPHRHLDISQVITAESSPLHIDRS